MLDLAALVGFGSFGSINFAGIGLAALVLLCKLWFWQGLVLAGWLQQLWSMVKVQHSQWSKYSIVNGQSTA